MQSHPEDDRGAILDQLDPTKLLARLGTQSWRRHKPPPDEGVLPVGWTSESTARLDELRRSYSAAVPRALQGPQWTPRYVANNVRLTDFRGQSAFMWQEMDYNFDANYICTYLHLRRTEDQDLLDIATEDDLFGVSFVTLDNEILTRDRLDSALELAFIRRNLCLSRASSITILDIGSGYGRFAHRTIQFMPNASVICVDVIPESSFLCEFYLRYRHVCNAARMLEFGSLSSQLTGRSVDLAVAINSLTECSSAAIRWWASKLNDLSIRYLLIVPHAAHGGGTLLYSRETPGTTPSSIVDLLRGFGYRPVVREPKYSDPALQRLGVSPTYYHLFERMPT